MDKYIILKKELKGFNINIDDIEPNDNILGALEQQVKKQKEVIDKVKLTVKGTAYCGSEDYYMEKLVKSMNY